MIMMQMKSKMTIQIPTIQMITKRTKKEKGKEVKENKRILRKIRNGQKHLMRMAKKLIQSQKGARSKMMTNNWREDLNE